MPYRTTQPAATTAMAPSLGWIRQILAISPVLMNRMAPARTIAPRAGIGSIASGPVRKSSTTATAPAATIPAIWVCEPADSDAWVRDALELTG